MKKIPEFRLIPQPLDDQARSLKPFQFADGEIGERHKLGGVPQFIQEENIPACPDCNQPMTFYAQLDSINDDFCIADCGMIYIFICFDCINVKSFIQTY